MSHVLSFSRSDVWRISSELKCNAFLCDTLHVRMTGRGMFLSLEGTMLDMLHVVAVSRSFFSLRSWQPYSNDPHSKKSFGSECMRILDSLTC